MEQSFSISFLFPFLFLTTVCVISGTPLDRYQSRVVGGDRVKNRQQFPYQVSLRINEQHVCGGTIYKPHYVITAGHCVSNFKASQMVVVAGDLHLSRPTSHTQSIRVEKFTLHEAYSDHTRNDVAVIKLKKDFVFDSYVMNATIWNYTASAKPEPPLKCVVSGWGSTHYNGAVVRDLRAAEVNLFEDQTCKNIYGRNYFSKAMVCAGDFQQSKDACSGDSGGPLVCQGHLYGIVSWGVECGHKELPGVYTNASYYREWIDEHTSAAYLGLPSFIMTLLLFAAGRYIS